MPSHSFSLRASLLIAAAAAGVPRRGAAQEARAGGSATWALGAQGIGVVTRASPAFVGRDFTEGYLTQPAVMGHAALLGGRLALRATLDLEGLTLGRGELTPGSYGEGYVDRRHPHTYSHELVATVATDAAGARRYAVSLSAGKGFAPFGTDDPMSRPFVKFPANHHLAQILERVAAVGAVRAGALILEGGAFNGDEPVGPGEAPTWRRFGDSWAGRLTLAPRGGRLAGVELQGSHAWVESPELAGGGGVDQRKWSTSVRAERGMPDADGHRYALVEWARTDDVANGHRSFSYTSLLGEGALTWRATQLALRLERTERPEEERLADPFRAARPYTDFGILGRTRWDVVTTHVGLPRARAGALRLGPFVEVARARARALDRPSAFEPASFFGSATQWSFSTGLRLELGTLHRRMGRYGAAEPAGAHHAPHEGRMDGKETHHAEHETHTNHPRSP
ncbi:MAG: hypothetical protein ACJ79S_13805 [Gemmatimonadaceae bacterium]